MPSKNPLDLLFKDLKKELALERAEEQRLKIRHRPEVPQPSPYSNPENWVLGRVVSLIHATEGAIGNFQEYYYKGSSSTRRLMPAAEGLLPVREELVFGDYWLHPQFSTVAPEHEYSDGEVKEIHRRFYSLMEEFEDL